MVNIDLNVDKIFFNKKMNFHHLTIILYLFLLGCLVAKAQQPTVGLITNTENAFNGYTLFNAGPKASGGFGGNGAAYLINNCGEIINFWTSEYNAGLSCYLDYKGNLVRPIQNRENNTMGGPGGGGGVEMQDWEGNVIWLFDYNENTKYLQHHDIEPLPNGNILLIAWEQFTAEETAEYGRTGSLTTEHIVEVKPTGPTSGEIVWEWHLIDHTVQHNDTSLQNYGVIVDNPQLIDINLGNAADHIHLNSIDYLEEFDLILLSSRFLSEIYVIDHSTTTQQAASHTGGNYGKGGDILYRWGNPRNYNKGDIDDQKLRSQHGAHWVPSSYNNGQLLISIFNNNSSSTSFLVAIEPPVTTNGNFLYDAEIGFDNTKEVLRQSVSAAPTGSSCAGLPNGNFLYSINRTGEIGEVDSNGDVVWEYIIPTNSDGPVSQGQTGTSSSFNAQKYGPDFIGFNSKDLSPKGPIELNPYPNNCIIYGEQLPELPVANFTNTVGALLTMFNNNSTGEIDSLIWDFGDGNTSNNNTPYHLYEEEGDYYVCLTAINKSGSNVYCDTITVAVFIDVALNEKTPVSIFPNPAKDIIFIDGLITETEFTLYNSAGQTVLTGHLADRLIVDELANGKYYLRLPKPNEALQFIINR